MSGIVSSLASLSTLITKGTTPTTLGYAHADSGIPFLRVQNIFGGQVNFEEDTLFIGEDTHSALKRSQIQGGDVLVTIAGTIGRTGVVPLDAPSMNCNQAVAIVRPTAQIDRSYLRHWLESQAARSQMIGSTVTGTISNLSLTQLGELKVPLPPLADQRRIAAILDQAETLRTQRRAALAQLDSLTQSLFLDMFGDPRTNPVKWREVTVGAITDSIVPGRDKPKSFSGGVPWITTANLIHMGATLPRSEGLGLNQSEIDEVRAKVIPVGSVIISCVGDLGIVSIAGVPMVINQQLHSFQCGDELNNVYLMYALSFQKAFMLAKASSTTLPYMNKSVCNSIPVLVPPLALQQTFATRIQAIESLKTTHRTALTELDALFASLQQRAFAGEL